MTDAPLPYDRIADRFDTLLAAVTTDQWQLPTPCTDWDVTGLVQHVVATHRRVYKLADPTASAEEPGEDDLVHEWRVATATIRAAVADPDRAQVEVAGRAGTQNFAGVVAGLLSIDTLCHTWDLARATGQDETLDPEAVAGAHARLLAIDAAIRVPGGFAEAIASAPTADAQALFLNFAGRRT